MKHDAEKFANCPVCESHNLSDMWRKGRKLRQECRVCGWVGKERTPEQRAINPIRKVRAGTHGEHTFDVFDRYGHVRVSSRSYSTDTEARGALTRELAFGVSDKDGGPYIGILWPATVTVEGEII